MSESSNRIVNYLRRARRQICAALFLLFMFQVTALGREPVTIYLAGDSTMAEKKPEKRPETGWGEFLGEHFRDGKIKIVNLAQNGRSTKTFISEGHWQKIIDAAKKGDYVFIQFGHNDSSKEKGERYTPPADFTANLTKMVAETRAKKAIPVLLTPVVRRRFNDQGEFYDSHGEYPNLTRNAAKNLKTDLIDLQRITENLLKEYGAEKSRGLFLQLKPGEHPNYPNGIDDNTHFNPTGAAEIAKLAVAEISREKIKLRKLLKK